MDSFSRGSTLTPCRSPTPATIPVEPDHFYGAENVQLPPSPDTDGKTWLDPDDDPMAHRGIPVFKPTMEEFQDFEGYMNRVECWGNKSGIVKVIPPKEWTDSLPSIKPQLAEVKIKCPIQQHMRGSGGLFRQENMEKRKLMSVREWAELCNKAEFRTPGIQDVGLGSRGANASIKPRAARRKPKAETAKANSSSQAPVVIKQEPIDDSNSLSERSSTQAVTTPPQSEGSPPPVPVAGPSNSKKGKKKQPVKVKAEPKEKPKRVGRTREAREAGFAERAARDLAFIDVFDPNDEWLPPGTTADDYTPEFCQKLERQYWRNCGIVEPAWYGADTPGSLFTDATTAWNVAHLPSALSRLLPASDQGLPGVNTPYLYFGMWRATFAWHVEDMDLFSINYIHFGAPKFWYAIPQGRSSALEQTMRSHFPKDTSQCPQFLRHKSFLASPTLLANSSCRPNHLVQQAGEFVITFPRGYHAGFNLGLNCAESVNFALESWLELGRRAKACECISDSVRIDVDQLLQEREAERNPTATRVTLPPSSSRQEIPKREGARKNIVKDENVDGMLPPLKAPSRKRKSDAKAESSKLKKIKINHSPTKLPPSSIPAKAAPKITLKLGPCPAEPEAFPCCLCVSMSQEGLLRVHEPPTTRKDAMDAAGSPKLWKAHEYCASIVPETWVDELEAHGVKEKVVFGVDGIVKDRWNLKCSACTKARPKGHGAPIQCTKGKCPKAFHINCARDGDSLGIVFAVVREVEKEVVLLDPSPRTTFGNAPHDSMQVDPSPTACGNAVTMDTTFTYGSSNPRVLKIIKKLEVQILCTQHNPAVAAQKKASKHDRIRNELLALPAMSRIKIRVSAGVFEVSLIRVMDEIGSVEVVWDRGLKKEFKWGSVVFGTTDGPVLQKPSEIVAEPERPQSALPVTTFPSVLAATGQQPHTATHSPTTPPEQTKSQTNATPTMYAPLTQPMYPRPTGPYDYWTYASKYSGQTQYPYSYTGYYPAPMSGGSQPYPYTYAQTYNQAQAQYRGGRLHWQQPYQGPSQSQAMDAFGQFQAGGSGSAQTPQSSEMVVSQTVTNNSYYRDRSQPTSSQFVTPNPSSSGVQSVPHDQLNRAGSHQGGSSSSASSSTPVIPESFPGGAGLSSGSQSMISPKDLAGLASMQPAQITEILRSNPQLRDLLVSWATVDQGKPLPSS
ncbi:hypothetical protein M413DRAFT_379857 [Hebeloma cylindrosporum]|uniref:[histone H3]-trimethyl-L-lysine(9) demethylase n=1 Tax=Hebeloma cylindrosporum TaxID=76867 RepID=A0A0C3CJU1_HEBCY|nr:hypothetical protein M413DRAFT_379857 [Hebeloma cylindrosporum h7]